MKRSEQDRLLGKILVDENVERLRVASLASMLAVTRRRRRQRTLLSGAAATLALAMLAVALVRREIPPPMPERQKPEAATAEITPSRVKIINDEQLLALFPGRDVALIGAPGAQRLVFLDGPQTSR